MNQDDLLAALGIAGATGAYGLARGAKGKLMSRIGKTPGRAHFVPIEEDGNAEPEHDDEPDVAA